MPLFVGLDASKHKTSICILDADGGTVAEGEVATEPKDIIAFLRGRRERYRRIGIEAMSLASWLYEALAKAGLPIICIDARHAHGVLKARLNKTDRNDARGIAEIMRVGIYKAVHIKSAESQQARLLLIARRMLRTKSRDLENLICGALLQSGMKVSPSAKAFDVKVRELVRKKDFLRSVISPLLDARADLIRRAKLMENCIRALAKEDPVCRRLMTVPGVASIVALTYRTSIDIPGRFADSRNVGVHLGLTVRVRRSGLMERRGNISKIGDATTRSALFSAARVILFSVKRQSRLRDWGLEVKSRRGAGKAMIAVARRLAVILHRMWTTDTDFHDGAVPA
jgi:transposase